MVHDHIASAMSLFMYICDCLLIDAKVCIIYVSVYTYKQTADSLSTNQTIWMDCVLKLHGPDSVCVSDCWVNKCLHTTDSLHKGQNW